MGNKKIENTTEKSKKDEKESTILTEVLDWIYCITLAIVITLLIKNLFFSTTIVKMSSMFPTLQDGNILFINRFAQVTGTPLETGDIVVFEEPLRVTTVGDTTLETNVYAQYPEDNLWTKFLKLFKKTLYIKRVIGTAGDRLVIDGDEVSINGEILDEDYKNPERYDNNIDNSIDIEIPEGYIFCMGDNRDQSMDSRAFGLVPISKVEGKATFRLFPFDKFGNID